MSGSLHVAGILGGLHSMGVLCGVCWDDTRLELNEEKPNVVLVELEVLDSCLTEAQTYSI
jgi:hypothetical protein